MVTGRQSQSNQLLCGEPEFEGYRQQSTVDPFPYGKGIVQQIHDN